MQEVLKILRLSANAARCGYSNYIIKRTLSTKPTGERTRVLKADSSSAEANSATLQSGENGWQTPTDRIGTRYISRENVLWYPGHMNTAMRTMNRRLVTCDALIEVHDARIPMSGRNSEIESWRGARPHVLILNKADLTEATQRSSIEKHLRADGFANVYLASLHRPERVRSFLRHVLRDLVQLCDAQPRPNRRFSESRDREYTFLVCGIPNVGKSTLINAFRSQLTSHGKAAQVGKLAGVTRTVHERIRVSDEPRVYVIDTPGILAPSLRSANFKRTRGDEEAEAALKVGVCAGVNLASATVDLEAIADYLLFRLNAARRFDYVQRFALHAPTDNVVLLLAQIAAVRALLHRVRAEFTETQTRELRPDVRAAAWHFIAEFNAGRLGKLCLDDHLLQPLLTSNDRRVPFALRGAS